MDGEKQCPRQENRPCRRHIKSGFLRFDMSHRFLRYRFPLLLPFLVWGAAGILLLVFAALGLAGCFQTQKGKERAIARGKLLFELHCCGCHNGKRSDLAKVPPNLAGIFERPRLPSGAPAVDAQVLATVLEGRSEIMPSFRDSLSDEDISNIIRYLHSVGSETHLCAAH
jgi:mono/diheme cytochrome c family protein